ncbi:PREDICTED: uncharacterized protein LOC101293527 [Fragaria vesca subsp. vesca]
MNQPKRPNPTSLPSDLDPSSPAKKSKTNGSDQENGSDLESSLAELGWTPEDLLLTPEERAEKAWTAYFAKRDPSLSKAFRKVELPESLPEGCAWGSYVPGSGQKKFVYVICCYNCGARGAHLTDDCPDKDTDEAKEFRRECLTLRVPSSGHETKPENK